MDGHLLEKVVLTYPCPNFGCCSSSNFSWRGGASQDHHHSGLERGKQPYKSWQEATHPLQGCLSTVHPGCTAYRVSPKQTLALRYVRWVAHWVQGCLLKQTRKIARFPFKLTTPLRSGRKWLFRVPYNDFSSLISQILRNLLGQTDRTLL